MEKGINSGELQYLSPFFNPYILPTIMLLGGDSVFPHQCGYRSIGAIIQSYLQHGEIKLIDNNNLKKLKWSRDNY